jgi:hypothetical protein
MKISHFDSPGNIDDLAGNAGLQAAYSTLMSGNFDFGVQAVTDFLGAQGGGTCQFYNPVTAGRTDPDLLESAGDVTWNGFPKQFSAAGPGQPTRFADAEPVLDPGQARLQDEYLEWHVNRNDVGNIVSVHFTCEAWDYFEFLGQKARDKVLQLYHDFVSRDVQPEDLFPGGGPYDRLNKWNTAAGAMHLTHQANNLFAEVFLAASATVRRTQDGAELTSSIPLIKCAKYGEASRNSDPNIGIAINGLAREGRRITLANPVGLYMASFDGAGLTLKGKPAGGFFRVVRGKFPRALRAVYDLPADQAVAGLTVSDVMLGGQNLQFGGQLAQRITMHLVGVASVDRGVNDTPVGCGAIPDPTADAAPHSLAGGRKHPPLRSEK